MKQWIEIVNLHENTNIIITKTMNMQQLNLM